jgi:hypothetical protein
MFTKTALTAAIILGTASAALAFEHDPNLANRYPGFTGPIASTQVFQSAPVALQTRNVALSGGQFVGAGYDRAGASTDGGTGR